jgi:hypothetical protein
VRTGGAAPGSTPACFSSPGPAASASSPARSGPLIWLGSGNHRLVAERDNTGVGWLGGGELLMPGESRLGPGESYCSPWLYGSWGRGINELSGRFHAYPRSRATHPHSPRTVTLSTWEAVYFDHNLGRLSALADAGAEVGVERFVLDNGWFGSRRSDKSGSGRLSRLPAGLAGRPRAVDQPRDRLGHGVRHLGGARDGQPRF